VAILTAVSVEQTPRRRSGVNFRVRRPPVVLKLKRCSIRP
jgi:hypothetical protein